MEPPAVDLGSVIDAIAARVATRVAEHLAPLLKEVRDAVVASELLDTPGAAAHIGCSTQFLEVSRTYGGGPRHYKIGRRVKYAIADLDEFLVTRKRDNTARPFRSGIKPRGQGLREKRPAGAENVCGPNNQVTDIGTGGRPAHNAAWEQRHAR